MHNIFFMGGFGWYVWPAYLITLTVLGINFLQALFEKKRIKQFIKNYHE